MKLEDFIKKHGNVSVNEDDLKELLGIKDEKYFMPKIDEVYWFVTYRGNVTSETHMNWDTDIEICEHTKVFRTEEEAVEHARKQRFLLKMERDFLDNSDDIDVKDNTQDKHHIYYSGHRGEIGINTWQHVTFGTLVTTNKLWLEEYIEKYEEEIKRYYFEIKEEK